MSHKPQRRSRPSVRVASRTAAQATATEPASPPAPARPLMADLMEALSLRTEDAERAVTRHNQQQAILHKLIEQAAKGDARSAQILIALKREGDAERTEAPEPGEVSAEDRAVLADFARQLREADGEPAP
jgi:hypothetical protein